MKECCLNICLKGINRSIRFFLLVLLASNIFQVIVAQENTKLLLVAGGHRFDTTVFFSIFHEMAGIDADIAMQPEANILIASGVCTKYDAIVFYDSWKYISGNEKEGYLQLLNEGVGMIFLHHSLVSYQNWPGFMKIIGGKYKKPRFEGDTANLSGYKHDILMSVTCNQEHPVTSGIKDFEIMDEGYMNIDVLSTVTPLLTTKHNYCDEVIGWAHKVDQSNVLYLLPGHDKNGLCNVQYLEIIKNAIYWADKRNR